jgi:hypothetical protein
MILRRKGQRPAVSVELDYQHPPASRVIFTLR